MGYLAKIDTFGTVGAEDDNAILQYFLSTNTVRLIETGRKLLILGRKGAGKTALVRHFENRVSGGNLHVALRLRDYPWTVHAKRKALGSSEIEVFVASWRYLIAVQTLSALLKRSKSIFLSTSAALAREFLSQNYSTSDVDLRKTLTPNRIIIESGKVKGGLFGLLNKEVNWERQSNDLGHNLDEITDALMSLASDLALEQKLSSVFLHFDELDQGLHLLKEDRKLLLTGLIISARSVVNRARSGFSVKPIIYLRTDIWDQLAFADKNKIAEDLSQKLTWSSSSLLQLVNLRIAAKTGNALDWKDVTDGKLMRGRQEKWGYILARTFLRPRDVIAYLNYALERALERDSDADVFTSDDIFNARGAYSAYLKRELDEEILPHWAQWEEAMRACSAIATLTMRKDRFQREYDARRTANNPFSFEEACDTLFGFSVIGYRRGRAQGGTEWIYQYANENAKWDALVGILKVHVGLKEYFGLAEASAE